MRKLFLSMLVFLSVFAVADARKVSGRVHCEGQNLSGVLVTDGTNFTVTKNNGTFKFDIEDNAKFVSVVTPAGFVADFSNGTPEFYRAAEGQSKFDFNLQKTDERVSYTLFSISDPQVRNKAQMAQFAGKPCRDLKAQGEKYSASGPVVAIMLGDLGWDKTLPEIFKSFKKECAKLGFPVYVVTGNHDYNKERPFEDYSVDYNANFGPYNYAFFMGQDLIIGLKNIQYVAEKQYIEAYSEEEIAFVKGLLSHVSKDMHIFIANHSPISKGWNLGDKSRIQGFDELANVLKGHKVDFLSGHSHIMNNVSISENIMDHNAAAISGSWWIEEPWCRDGTPSGYEIFSVKGDKINWFYHTLETPDNYQVEIIKPGQSLYHPNSIVANIWDWDEAWTVKWFEDGKDMGEMVRVKDVSPSYIKIIDKTYEDLGKEIPAFRSPKLNTHYFTATPSQYAKKVTICVTSRFGQEWIYDVDMSSYVDAQAHRGGAGLWPENTLTSMTNAVEMGVNTLELDLQISQDKQIVVSHDAYFHARYATRPDGTEVKPEDPKEYLYTMPYDSIAKYDVGKRPSTVWPGKEQKPEIKPLASVLIDSMETRTTRLGRSPMRYNIEIKCKEGKTEGINWPEYHEFVDRCIELLLSKNLGDRLVVQCFDVRALNYMHEKYPQLKLSYLTGSKDVDYDTYMSKLNFKPDWLSPHYSTVNETIVKRCHEDGIKIVPWTADDPAEIQRLIDLHVDAIISNYPDRLLKATRGYVK